MSIKLVFLKKKLNKSIKYLPLFIAFFFSIALAFLLGILVATKLFIVPANKAEFGQVKTDDKKLVELQKKVLKDKYVFKIRTGNLGKQMIEDGVIDKTKFAQAITGQDKLPQDLDKYFTQYGKDIEVTSENSQFWVDFLWALGLANKNKILESGDMMQGQDASGFASTGGWTLGAGDPMNYYSKFSYINLNEKQQKMVEDIASNIYRPCCGNSTAFPDCNHGMAALGLIELMVSQGKSSEEIYKTVLALNTYWFPDTYLNIAYHFDKAGQDYNSVSAKKILSKTFSSAMGAEVIAKEAQGVIWPALNNGGGSCGA